MPTLVKAPSNPLQLPATWSAAAARLSATGVLTRSSLRTLGTSGAAFLDQKRSH
jgi:hypothetical protein